MEEMNNTVAAAPAAEESVPATVFGFAPEGMDEQGADAPADTGTAEANMGENQGDAAPATEDRRSNAFAAQRRDYQRRLDEAMNDPAMALGNQLIRDVMEQSRCSREQAVQIINDRFVQAYAKRENVGQDAARKLYNMEQRKAEPSMEDRARKIVDDLMAVDTPEGFDMDAAVSDPTFQQLLVDMPASAAVRVYDAEQRANRAPQQVADRLRARNALPQTSRPAQSVNAVPDFKHMSSAEFFAYKQKYGKNY